MNALKSVLGAAINAAALITFVIAGKVRLATCRSDDRRGDGRGYAGATHARTLDPARVLKRGSSSWVADYTRVGERHLCYESE